MMDDERCKTPQFFSDTKTSRVFDDSQASKQLQNVDPSQILGLGYFVVKHDFQFLRSYTLYMSLRVKFNANTCLYLFYFNTCSFSHMLFSPPLAILLHLLVSFLSLCSSWNQCAQPPCCTKPHARRPSCKI